MNEDRRYFLRNAFGGILLKNEEADLPEATEMSRAISVQTVHSLLPSIQALEPCDAAGTAFSIAQDFCLIPSLFYRGTAKLLVVFADRLAFGVFEVRERAALTGGVLWRAPFELVLAKAKTWKQEHLVAEQPIGPLFSAEPLENGNVLLRGPHASYEYFPRTDLVLLKETAEFAPSETTEKLLGIRRIVWEKTGAGRVWIL